ncbi:conserved hypothetical protein [groundwater metagenome]|uniref:Integrase catalytic domain-containing protein n=1 Tax=groundwater metagenome TaxID=717931 RepID=A0A098E6Y3_9ZZZZ
MMEKLLLINKRIKARELHKQKGWSIRKISRYLVASRDSINKWIKTDEKEVTQDNRGWKKGKPRKYTEQQKEEIKNTRMRLEKEESFFIGAKVVQANYNTSHIERVSKDFVDRALREYEMVKSPQKKRKGVSKYMQYPQYTLNKLGKIVMSMDFIGPKYLKGSKDKINFLSCKYIRPKKEGIVKRIGGQTTDEAIRILKEIWQINHIPDVLKVDNDSAFGTNLSQEMCVGRLTLFLLNIGIKPLYVAPRSPWNNGEVEGFNSVFSRKFWNKLKFTDENEIDIKIKDFNVSYEKYNNLINNNPEIEKPKYINDCKDIDFENKGVKKFKETKIYFLRIVRRKGEKAGENEYGFIDILKQEIKLPKNLINLFVYCILDTISETLSIHTEGEDGKLNEIKTINFKIKNIIS